MNVGVTLRFLQAVIQEHVDRMPDAGLTVLPCVHEDADTADDADLFGAAIRRAGGVFVHCSPEVSDWSFPGPLNEPLARYFSELCSQNGIAVDFEEVDGSIRAIVDGSDSPTASSSTLAQVLSFLCSSLMDTEFVVYSYTTDGLDQVRARLLWAAANSVQMFPPTGLQTLVSVACGWVDVVLHCNPSEGAARLVVRGPDLIRRPPRRSPDARITGLISSVDDPIVLFLGAGASASARIPQGDALRNAAISHITSHSEASEHLIGTFRQYLEDAPHRYLPGEREMTLQQFEQTLTLERVLREEFHKLSGRPRADSQTVRDISRYCAQALDRNPPGRSAIWRLAELLPRLVIATINFDELVETGMSAERQVVASESEFARARDLISRRVHGDESTVPILKVHGTIADPDTMVADIETTRRGLPVAIEQALDATIPDDQAITWVWIGCSMRDVDMRHWLQRHTAERVREFWVDPLPPPSVSEYALEVRAKEWAKMGHTLADRQITESSDVFLPALVKYAEELAAASGDSK